MKMIRSLMAASLLTGTALLDTSADSLREHATAAGLDWIIGNWADKETNGATFKLAYEWRLDGHAVAIKISAPDREAEGMIARNAKTNEVGYIVIDNHGGGALGKVERKEGTLVVKLSYSNSQGEEKKRALTHTKTDTNTMKFVLSELSDSGEIGNTKEEFELVRMK
jgi:hypothetical protein